MSTGRETVSSESEDEEELQRQIREKEQKLERIRMKKAAAQKNEAELLSNPSLEGVLQVTKSSDHLELNLLDNERSASTATNSGPITNVSHTPSVKESKSGRPTSPSIVPIDWTNAAFGTFTSPVELEKRLILLNRMLSEVKQPSIEFQCLPLNVSNANTVVCVKGKLVRPRECVGGKRSKIEVEITSVPMDSAGAGVPESIRVIVVESGVGKEIFKRITSAFQAYSENDDQLLVVQGIVQFKKHENDTKPIICINHKNHIVLIALEPLKYPVVHDMDGIPIEFPMFQDKDNARKLQGTFSGAWFCPLSDSKLTKPQVDQLRQHISAYRGSGGGVIYLGLKRRRIKPEGYEVENVAVELSSRNLEGLKRQVEEACKVQCPPCCAKEWDSRELPDDIKQRFDHCFNTYFTTTNRSYFVVRMIVCPSKHPLHLCCETDIGLHKRHGTTSSSYPIGEFVSIMSETTLEVSQKLEHLPSGINIRGPVVKDGPSLALWQKLDPEGGTLDNKALCFDDPVDKTMEKLEEYVPVWLNDTTSTGSGGRLRMGVSDKTPLVTGVWLDNSTVALLTQRLVERYKGSLKPSDFCFPSAIEHFSLTKHQIIARPDAVLGKSNKVLVLWLKVSPNASCSSEFEPHDAVCRRLYCSWAKKSCPVLKSLFDLGQEHPPLVLPLNSCLRGLLPPTEGGFPVVISKPHSLSPEQLDKLVDALLHHLMSKTVPSLDCVVSHQFLDCDNVTDFLDANYCIMDIIVNPSKQSLLHMCKLPEFWKIDKPSEEEEFHIFGCPRQMTFQEIVIRCSDSNRAKNHLSTFFQFNNDRPILITDVGNLDCSVTKGLACIPWTLVVDFDFGDGICPNGNTLRDIAEKDSSYVYKITDLSLNNFGPVNSADMSDISPVYWVKALGPSSERITDLKSWRLQLSQSVCKYITQACSSILSKVKILVVWSALPVSSQFGQAVCDLCLAAQQAKMYDKTEITVVCPTFASPFISKFKDLPDPPEILSIELNTLSDFLLQQGPKGNPIDDWRRIPGKTMKLHVATVKRMQAAELDYLYPNIENHLDMTSYDNGLAFFEGRARFVRWEDFKAKNVVERPETQQLYKRVKSCLENRRDTTALRFTHYPGAGGSTVARSVMWRLKKSFCCIVPSQLYRNMRQDVKHLIDASEGRAVLVMWDHDLGIVFDDLMSELKGLNAVILRVERLFESGSKANVQIDLKENLSFNILEQFYTLLCRNTHFSNSKEVLDFLLLYTKRMKEDVPLFLVMVTALENKFLRLRDYVKERLIDITEEQKSILIQIAFARVYTGKALQVTAVNAKDRNWETSLPSSISGLITFFQLHSRCVRMRHHCIDAIILSVLSGYDNTSSEWGLWLADYVVNFIDHLRNVYPVPEWDNYGNNINEFERVLRWLFHDKPYNAQISHFESLIGSLAGKDAVITCMRGVEGKLPKKRRIQAHFLGDLARVHLHIDNMDLDAAVQVMKEAHIVLPLDRTLYHQEGQLYFDAMTLTQGTLLVPKDPPDLANDIIKLSQKASDCYAISRDCKMQGRASELYPWSSDLQCHIKCLTDICSIMKCSFHTLPKPLATQEYILNAQDDIAFLLDTLSTEDPFMYNDSLKKILHLLGNDENVDAQLQRLFLVIETAEPKEKAGHTNSHEKAKALQHINFLLRLRYGNARHVPETFCTSLTQAVMNLIDQPRVINSALAQKGHKDRFFELELLWDWSRYSKLKISRIGILSIIDKFMENLTSPSLQRAKCLLFKGVTMLLQLLCDHNRDVNPDDVTKYISECNSILENLLQNENRNWRYSEFLITGNGKELLSSKNWFWKDSLHRAINDSEELNRGYSKHTEFHQFSGQVYRISSDRYGEVTCEGLSLCFIPNNAPDSWKRVNVGIVNFYISVSSQKGLQAYPVCPLASLENDKRHIPTHRWQIKQLQPGCIVGIDKDKGLVYFAPPNYATQPYGAYASCRIDDLPIKPEEGDLYEFDVTRLKVDRRSEPRFIASKLHFIERGKDRR